MKHFVITLICCVSGSFVLFAQSQYGVDKASSTPTSSSPGFVFSWSQYASQNFLYDGQYINHYGFGFHDFDDSTSIGGLNAYMSSYFGLDFFTGGHRRFRINANGTAIIDENLGIGGTPATKLDVGNFQNGNLSNHVVLRLRNNALSGNQSGGWGSAMEFVNNDYNGNMNEGGAKIISEASDYGWTNNLKFRVVTNNGYSSQTGIDALTIVNNGNVGVGTSTPDAKLAVKGVIHSQEVKVDMLGSMVPDYVFEKDYHLPSLDSIKTYIDQHKHLPEVPSAKEIEANGVNLGEMNMILLKKVEELTLYTIELKAEIEKIKSGDLK